MHYMDFSTSFIDIHIIAMVIVTEYRRAYLLMPATVIKTNLVAGLEILLLGVAGLEILLLGVAGSEFLWSVYIYCFRTGICTEQQYWCTKTTMLCSVFVWLWSGIANLIVYPVGAQLVKDIRRDLQQM